MEAGSPEDDVYEELGGRMTPHLQGGGHRPKTPTPLGQPGAGGGGHDPPITDPTPTPGPGRRLYKSTRDNKPLHPVGSAKKLAARRQEERGAGAGRGAGGGQGEGGVTMRKGKVAGRGKQVNGGGPRATPGPGRVPGDGDSFAVSDRASHSDNGRGDASNFSHEGDRTTTRGGGQVLLLSESRTHPVITNAPPEVPSRRASRGEGAPTGVTHRTGKPLPKGAPEVTQGHLNTSREEEGGRREEEEGSGEGVSVGKLQVVKEDKGHRRLGGAAVKAIPSWTYWQEGPWAEGFPDETLTMDVTDISPGFAIRKMALLYENGQYGECTALVRRLSPITLKTIVPELPVELLVESLPHSVPVLEALYSRFYQADPAHFPAQYLLPERVVSGLVRWIATMEGPQSTTNTYYTNYESIIPYAQSIIRTISLVQPAVRRKLRQRRRGLVDCAESLGDHGLVDTSDSKLMNLHDALKIEFNKMIQQLKGAIMKLETVSFSQRLPIRTSLSKGGAPSGASHQRLLQLTHTEVQERLIKNKSLLNVVEPAMSNSYLAGLIQTLEGRIDADKGILFHFAELRRDMIELPQHALIAPLFQQYAHAYSRVLDVILAVTDPSDTNGYHSNDDEGEGPSKRSLSGSQNSGKVLFFFSFEGNQDVFFCYHVI